MLVTLEVCSFLRDAADVTLLLTMYSVESRLVACYAVIFRIAIAFTTGSQSSSLSVIFDCSVMAHFHRLVLVPVGREALRALIVDHLR